MSSDTRRCRRRHEGWQWPWREPDNNTHKSRVAIFPLALLGPQAWRVHCLNW
jgi:hypothetical protein